MAIKIKPLRKFTTGTPTTSDMVEGEIAVNTADKKVFMRDNGNNIVEVGASSELFTSGAATNIDVNGRVTADTFKFKDSNTLLVSTVYTGSSYLVQNEIQEILSITPNSNSENYTILGTITLSSGSSAAAQTLNIHVSVRSNVLPDLAFTQTYNEELTVSNDTYITPILFTKETSTASVKLCFKVTKQIFGVVSANLVIIPRIADDLTNVSVNTTAASEFTGTPTGFTERAFTRTFQINAGNYGLQNSNTTKIQATSTGATVTGTLVSDSLSINTNELMTDANGNVGIGTNDPQQKLHVAYSDNNTNLTNNPGSDITTGMRVNNTNSTADSYASIDLRANNGDVRLASVNKGTNTADFVVLVDKAGNTTLDEALRVTSEGHTNLTSSADGGPLLTLISNDHSDAADFGQEGAIRFVADNDANQSTEFARIYLATGDISDGTEDGWIYFNNIANGTINSNFAMGSNGSFYLLSNAIDNPVIEWNATGGTSFDVQLRTAEPSGDRTIILPNASGTVITTGNLSDISSIPSLTTLTVDDITINGSTISDSGDFTLDVGGDITFDADGGDFKFLDGGTEFLRITNSSSDAIIRPVADAKDIIFQQRDGTEVARIEDNGTFNVVTDKLAINGTAITSNAGEINKLDGVTATTTELNYVDVTTLGTVEASKAVTADSSGNVLFPDNEILKIGDSGELEILNNGTNSVIRDVGSGSLSLQSNGAEINLWNGTDSEYMAEFHPGGTVALYNDGSKKFETSSGGVIVTGMTSTSGLFSNGNIGNTQTAKGVYAGLSTAGDAQIALVGDNTDVSPQLDFSHDVSIDYDARLILENAGNRLSIKSHGNETMANFNADGAVELYHDTNKKFETTSTGVTVTGTVTATTFSGTANVAETVTVTDSSANANFPVVFHNESNSLLDDTGALRYNPSTGQLLVPNLTVAGTTTTVNTVTMQAANAIVFEGATADDHETTLTITDPTTDRTITLPNATGQVVLSSGIIDSDASAEIGRAHIGYVGWDDLAGFSHVDTNSQTSYALLQSAGGITYLNAANGQTIKNRINNVTIFETSATGLTLASGYTLTSPKLRLTDTTDVTLSSTGHAFQTGPDNNLNIAIDGNEIQARNNGSASTLYLNISGGAVNVGPDLALTATDSGSGEDPSLDLYRNSSSPADQDVIGHIVFSGENDADEKITYGEIQARIRDVTDGTENGAIETYVETNGSLQLYSVHQDGESQFYQDVQIISSDAGATENPTLQLYRNSASPADNDTLGHITFSGENSAGEKIVYGEIETQIADQTDGTEDSRIRISGVSSGSFISYYEAKFGTNTFLRDVNIAEDRVIKFEGATNDGNQTTLTVTDPTQDNTITLPDATGTVVVGKSVFPTGTTTVGLPVPGALDLSRPVEDDDHVFHPYLNNDLGHFIERGGTHAWGGLSSTPSDAATKTLFNANGDFVTIANSSFTGTTATLTLTNLPKGLSYSAYTGVVFGQKDFAPTGMTIETSTNGGTSWTTRLTDSSQKSTYLTTFDSGGTNTNAIRYTFNKNTSGVRTDIRFQSITAYNYNSAGMENYFLPLDGGTIYGDTTFTDNSKAKFGGGDDLQIYHNGNHSYIQDSGTGDLVLLTNQIAIRNAAQNADIIRGIEGGAVTLSHNGSAKLATTSDGIQVTDTGAGSTAILELGTESTTEGGNLKINGTTANKYSEIFTSNGNLHIDSAGTTSHYIYLNWYTSDGNSTTGGTIFGNGNGGQAAKMDGSGNLTLGGDLSIADSEKAIFGNDSDFQIYHNGTNAYLQESTNAIVYRSAIHSFRNSADSEQLAQFNENGAVKLYFDNTERLRTTAYGSKSTGTHTSNAIINTYGSSSAPIIFTVTVGSTNDLHPYNGDGSSNKYLIDGEIGAALTLHGADATTSNSEYYYRFDQSDSSNSGHPLLFYLDAAKNTQHTTGVTTNGTPGSSGAYTQIAVTSSTPKVLYYQCSAHAYMGNYVTVATAGSSNADTLDNLDSTAFLRSNAADSFSGALTGTAAIELNSGVTYDPSSTGGGSDTATDIGISLGSGVRVVGHYDGYIRSLLEWNVNSTISIGQSNTSLIQGVNIFGGNGSGAANGGVYLYDSGVFRFGTTTTGAQVIGDLTLTSTDASDDANPKLDLYRNSASPADGDVLGHIDFSGEDSAGNKTVYAKINADISDVSSGTEDGRFDVSVISGGSESIRMKFSGNGVTSFYNKDIRLEQSVNLQFEGSTDDGYETTLTVTDPTADRTITLPNVSGTVLTTGNSDSPTTTTSSSDADFVLIDDGGTMKKITPANLGVGSGGGGSTAADDIATGDSAIVLKTTSGSIDLTTTASDEDIRFNGSDGGSVITALTLDMSDSGKAIFNAGATFGGDLTLTATDDTANSTPELKFVRQSASPADFDYIGGLSFFADNSADENIEFGTIEARLRDVTDGTEDFGGFELFGIRGGTARQRFMILNEERLGFMNYQFLRFEDGSSNHFTIAPPLSLSASKTVTFPAVTGTVLTTANSDTPGTTTSSGDADFVLIDDGGVMKKITPANLGIGGGGGGTPAADDISAGDAAVNLTTTSGNITIDAQGSNTDIIFKGTDGISDITALTLDMSDSGKAIFTGSASFNSSSDSTTINFGTITSTTDLTLVCPSDKTFSLRTGSDNILSSQNGNVIIDAYENNQDITFKGTDGGSDITALTLDMSEAGKALFNAGATFGGDVFLSSDSSNLHFGADNEITLSHVHNTGLRLSNQFQLQFYDANESISSDGTNLILKSGGTSFKIPTSDGSNGHFLKTNGSGTLSFAAVSGGGGSTAADDITTGDAEVTIATSSGDITIDTQGTDNDIIFKGTDGGSDITALRLDMSAEGNAIFNHDVTVGATGAFRFADSHTTDSMTGIFVDATETSNQQTNMIIQVGDDATTSNQDQVRIRHRHYSTSPQDLDIAIFKRDTSNGAIGNTAFNGIVTVSGAFSATTKSFDIKHPTKEHMRLRYGVLEGPEHGVYIRGKLINSNIIELPEHWTGLVDEDTITVQLTPTGKFQKLYVKEINDNKITIGNSSFFSNKTECFYFVQGTRKDVDELEIEYEN